VTMLKLGPRIGVWWWDVLSILTSFHSSAFVRKLLASETIDELMVPSD
jgi:hypothetical protein